MRIIPENNIIAFELLYEIEVGLREFLIETFGRNNQKWWKQRIPPDVLEKFKEGRKTEKNIKWVELFPHHPVYYIDFPDLRKIIERKDNWRDAFQNFLGERDVFCGGLRELEPIRNKIAHSRKITQNDINILKANVVIFENAIGKERWENLVLNQTIELSIYEKIILLKDYLKSVLQKMSNYGPIENLDTWQTIKNEWWFDDDYLCQELKSLECLYEKAVEYKSLPRYRGSGHVIEKWVKNNLSQDLSNQIEQTFDLLLAQKGL